MPSQYSKEIWSAEISRVARPANLLCRRAHVFRRAGAQLGEWSSFQGRAQEVDTEHINYQKDNRKGHWCRIRREGKEKLHERTEDRIPHCTISSPWSSIYGLFMCRPKSSPFRAKPKINFNVKTASFGSIQGLPMAASKTSVLVPSKLSKMIQNLWK